MTQHPLHDLQLSSGSGVPFYRQVVDKVADRVRSGGLQPGQQLPSVRDLAASLRVSLITIRRAYSDLEAAGLVIRRQGHGTFVSDEVGPAAWRQAHDDAHTALAQAVSRARALGLSDSDIQNVVDALLHTEETPR